MTATTSALLLAAPAIAAGHGSAVNAARKASPLIAPAVAPAPAIAAGHGGAVSAARRARAIAAATVTR
ncbi:hypothetical protein AB0M46_00580 [Dactylosporangium sp. NPDC051485]|uniref:hypothetical protein n=1 Tax=Dactylosporangium sp. NPDC051485 TaxID=3154846 RepID=UPI00343C661F